MGSTDMVAADGFKFSTDKRFARSLRTLFAGTLAGAALLYVDDSAGNGAVSAALTSPDNEEVSRVLALSNDLEWGEYLAGECATCHGATLGEGAVPVIHGINAERIVRALLEYRSGIRSNTTMGNVAGALGDEEVAVLAHYLAKAVP